MKTKKNVNSPENTGQVQNSNMKNVRPVSQGNSQQVQPNYNQQVQPNYNQQVQPNYNQQAQQNYNQQVQPNYNQRAQQNYNQQAQLNYNQQVQPNYNQQAQQNYNQQQNNQLPKKEKTKGKKNPFMFIIIGVTIIFAILLVVKFMNKGSNDTVTSDSSEITMNNGTNTVASDGQGSSSGNTTVVSTTGNVYDDLLNNLHNFDAYGLDALIGPENGDSYLAQEWAYVNRIEIRQIFIQRVCSLVEFTNVDSTTGNVTAVVPDYAELNNLITEDKDYILQWYKSADYTEDTSYTFDEDLFNLFCQWAKERVKEDHIPTTTIEINIPNSNGIITDDSELDMALFSTDALHECMKNFSQICVEFDGVGYTTRLEKVEEHNPEFDAWLEVFLKYYEEDGGTYDPTTETFSGGKFTKNSKWEPWYVRDEDNNLVYDEDGNKIVNYYTVKDENGKDWVQPDSVIIVEKEVQEEIEIPWEEERGIPYGIIGTYYIQHDYDGIYDTVFRSGDGSVEYPAGFGTPVVTKLKGTDGKFHAVKVALLGYWVEQEAIDYEEAFSNKNRGFSVTSPVQLICFEYSIINLEDEPFAFDGSEMTLCNRNANVSARSGTLYGFYDNGILEPNKKYVLNDWYSSTELYQKYVAWGRNFGRDYPLVFFDCLAGTGEVPSYSAYKQFIGTPSITDSAEE